MKKVLTLIVLSLLVLAGGVAYSIRRELHTPVHHAKSGQYIEIPRGTSPAVVLKKLVSEGVVKHEWGLSIYLKMTGRGSRFRAGEYDFPSPITPSQVFQKLDLGEQRLIRLTVIEGWTRWDIAGAMARMPDLHLADADSALKLLDDASAITDLDSQATDLEGYLYPDTYEFPPTTRPEEVVDMMLRRFRAEWKPDWSARAAAMNLSVRQVVTAASLIETEAKLQNERPLVASVIYNRLNRSMPLGIDSSVIYASKLAGKWKNDGKIYKSDIDRRSPYNTRLNTSLPPGPIASPSASSLQAALIPALTAYLYYVREPSRNDGTHNFYSTDRDFERGVQSLRNWEHQRDLDFAKRKLTR